MHDVKKTQKVLLLLPNYIGIKHPDAWLPSYFRKELEDIDLIFCESYRSAETLLDRQKMPEIELYEINEHTKWKKQEFEIMGLMGQYNKLAIISDAGLPCVADPGERIVLLAHEMGFHVKPLPGANSMILALAASGLNGEAFRFNGYLPIDIDLCKKKVVEMSQAVKQSNETQLFMETPYRNEKLLRNLMNWLPDAMLLSIAADILGRDELIKTCSVAEWKNSIENESIQKLIGKKPAVFLIGNP